jgi:RNA-directed DNA polymerase
MGKPSTRRRVAGVLRPIQGGTRDAERRNRVGNHSRAAIRRHLMDTGEPGTPKGVSPVRRGADGKGPHNWHLAGGLLYFVVLHHNLAVIEKIKEIVTTWLHGMGLELKPEKTRIAHTLRPQQGGAGFDFLGFEVRQYPVGKTHSARSSTGKLLGFKTLIKPSKEAQKRQLGNLATIVHAHQADAQFALIHRLNPVVHGWANYYRHVVSKDIFCRLDHQLHNKLQRWARRRHPGKSHAWVVQRYWQSHGKRHWVFASIDNVPLHTHADTPIERHAKVQGTRSPFDGDWIYWSLRCGHYPDISRTVSYLLRQQKGRCPLCGLYFKPGDVLERDHKVPRSQGGTDALTNRQLLHGHCHDRKTADDRVAVQVSVTRTG